VKRREFLKLGLATLATLWAVDLTKDSVVAEIELKEDAAEEWPTSCEGCFLYMCSPSCPLWWDRPYFVAGSCHPVIPNVGVEKYDKETYFHPSDLGIAADRNPSPEYKEWKEKTKV
jgi:hypothetical protein